tara:strand:+ start:5577 stop:6338 length:762 start_codon:yes stop_codon:yes gene_type:complete
MDNPETNNEIITENKTENNTGQKFTSQLTIYNIATGNIFNSNICNRITDCCLFIFSFGGICFGFIAWFVIDNITAVGYMLSGIFSGISLLSIRRMRLRAALQKSVNVLKEENEELKENNDDLKENIDELEGNIDTLEVVSKNLHNDLTLLKETIGIFGDNSEEIINNLREIYTNLKTENEIQANINKNTIYLHILHIIKHFDKKSQFILTSSDLEKAKNILLNAFPNLDYESLKKKIINNKITAEKIYETIKL